METKPDMISLEEAHEILDNHLLEELTERFPLHKTLGKVLAEDVYTDIDMPPFNKSAMDGFACKKEDLTLELNILETIQAGSHPKEKITSGACSKIMTGAMVPEGADIVIKIEDCEIINSNTIKCLNPNSKSNICLQAEDIVDGDLVISKGTLIESHHIAIMASVGHVEPLVVWTPRIGVLATGTELVESTQRPTGVQIRNSNSAMLMSQLKNIGIYAKYYGIAEDTEYDIRESIKLALWENDGVIITGGVSIGEFDLVPKALEELGLNIHFESIAIQPGKPVQFATNESRFCFALSGNPVSSMLQFKLLAKRFMLKTMGMNIGKETTEATLADEYVRKNDKRLQFVPVKLSKGRATLMEFHGSAHIYAFAYADAYLEVPVGIKSIKKGSKVNVRPIQ